jgi:hypothetical protein
MEESYQDHPTMASSHDESRTDRKPAVPLRIQYELVGEGPLHQSTATYYRKYRAVRRGNNNSTESVSFGQWARGLSQPDNAAELSEVMVGASRTCDEEEGRYRAVFWETPSVRPSSLETQAMEFVLLDAPTLQQFARTADPSPFAERFRSCTMSSNEQPVGCVFESLGRDAVLVSPRPNVGDSDRVNAAHLMAYLQTAPAEHRNSLWKTVGETYLGALREQQPQGSGDDAPRWLSTSGMGVAYLHVRIDRRPKYYTYDPYKQA